LIKNNCGATGYIHESNFLKLHLNNKITSSNITLTKANFSHEFNIKPELGMPVNTPVELAVLGVGLTTGMPHVPDEPLTYM
jgi:hypothetical protein